MEEEYKSNGEASLSSPGRGIHCITIVGQIEGHVILPSQNKTTKYELILPQLAAIEEDPAAKGLLILLNTMGGDVETRLAIAEVIVGMSKPTVSLVLGGGHSIGVPLAVAAKRCLIAPTASMILHPVRTSGTVLGVPQTFAYFQRIQQLIIDFIVQNSRIEENVLRSLMLEGDELLNDVGSLLGGKEAVRLDICDALGTLRDALDWLEGQIKR